MKKLLIGVAAFAALIVVLLVALSVFVDANRFTPALESSLSSALGRTVTIGRLRVSWLSGGVEADDLAVSDDPAFSSEPFLTAKSVSLGADLLPLVFSRSLRVESFTIDRPAIALRRSETGAWNVSSLGRGSSSSGTGAISVLVRKITVSNGRVMLVGLDASRAERAYDNVNVAMTDLSLASRCPFTVSANAPGGGTIELKGQAGPFNTADAAAPPFQAALTLAHLDVASSGVIDARAGIAGTIDFSGTLTSDGTLMTTRGTATATGVRLLPGATPARVPVGVTYESTFNAPAQTGTLKQADVHVGSAVARVSGDYRTGGAATTVRLSLRGEKMPITDLEAALPAVGVTLPAGARFTQGALDLTLSIAGPVDQLTIGGPIALSNAKLSGFDLGAKLGAVASLAGLQHVGDTGIESLTGMLQMTPRGLHVDAFTMVAPSIGTLTGDGAISPQGAMDVAMLATVREGVLPPASGALARVIAVGQSNGVPFRITGTTSNPVFAPDVRRAAQSAADSLKKAAQNPDTLKKAADALSGLFGRKPQ